MIPIHDRSEKQKSKIVIHKLAQLTEYDSSEAHRHNYFEFFVFENGGGVHLIDFEEFPIESNSVHIVAPGQVHQVKRELSSNGFVFLFDPGQFEKHIQIENFLFDHICFDVHEFSPNYTFPSNLEVQLKTVSKKAFEIHESDSSLKDQLVENQLGELLLYCMQTKSEENDSFVDQNSLYIDFRRLLKQEFKSLKKVQEYAARLSVSEKRLNEIVHQRTGETTSTLIYKQIVLEAKRLLNGGSSSKEIAYELNFNDPAHFSKFFKSQTGISPSEFLKST